MNAACPGNCRVVLTVAALGAELCHLGWEYAHGGVLAHHLLANPDLPAISNWWGLLVIPLLAWVLGGRIQAGVGRRAAAPGIAPRESRDTRSIAPWAGLVAALAYGAAMATAFALGSPVVEILFFALPVWALVIRLWHAQYVLGFVLGMTFVFGAVLPTLIAAVIAALSWVVHAVAGALRRRWRPPGGLA